MAVMARETWSDERLTYFEKSVDERFDRVDQRFDQVEAEFRRIDADLRELRQSMDRMTAIMVSGFLSLAVLIVSAQIFL
jgi:chromosome segregation ATPase